MRANYHYTKAWLQKAKLPAQQEAQTSATATRYLKHKNSA